MQKGGLGFMTDSDYETQKGSRNLQKKRKLAKFQFKSKIGKFDNFQIKSKIDKLLKEASDLRRQQSLNQKELVEGLISEGQESESTVRALVERLELIEVEKKQQEDEILLLKQQLAASKQGYEAQDALLSVSQTAVQESSLKAETLAKKLRDARISIISSREKQIEVKKSSIVQPQEFPRYVSLSQPN